MIEVLSIRNYMILCALSWLGATAYAQTQTLTGDQSQMEEAPATGTPLPPPPGFAPIPTEAAPIPAPEGQPSPFQDDSYFIPVEPSAGFDQFQDEDDGYGGRSGGGSREAKDSFKLVREPKARCREWRSDFLGATAFPDRGRCEFELRRKVDSSVSSIDSLVDRVELFKLKKVIKGELKSRQEAAKYSVSFDSLRRAIDDAAKKGCTCQD